MKPLAKKPKKSLYIVGEENPVLRQKAKEVPLKEIQTPRIRKVIADMKKALIEQDDGIGLAAPQIGIPLRIFIVSKKIFATPEDESKGKSKDTPLSKKSEDLVLINPVLTKESREKKWMEGEGCLSVRWIYGKVKRSTRVTLRAHTDDGKLYERGASGLLAHIFQHEVDHLNGILFIDKAKDLERIEPPAKSK